MSAPLAGVYVVAVEQAVAAPFATRQLADLGATVIKIERPGVGDFARHYDAHVAGQSAFFVWANRAKHSLELDIKDEADRELLEELIAGSDVCIQNLSVAAAQRAGLDADTLHHRYPHLIACDISGYGRGGPRTHDKAYDLAIQAEAAALALTGDGDQMSKVGFSVADISAGMYACSSILAALYRRATTGDGAAIEVSMLESLAEWTAAPVLAAAHTGRVPRRVGHRHAMIAPYGLWALADGSRVLIAVQSDPEWRALAEQVLQRPDLSTDARFVTPSLRIEHVDELELEIARVLGTLDRETVVGRLERARVAYAFVNGPHEVFDHAQLAARQRFIDVTTPTGMASMLRSPFNISGGADPVSMVPALGQHDPDVVQGLRRRGERARR